MQSAGGTEQRQAAVPSNGDVTIGPPYTTQPALTAQGAQRGTTFVVQWNMTSARTFNGTSPTFDGAECSGPRPGECCHKVSPLVGVDCLAYVPGVMAWAYRAMLRSCHCCGWSVTQW